jgi:hypothetical protein
VSIGSRRDIATSNIGADVLHMIDGLADRSYASVNDVLSAMEMVH